MPTSPAHAPCHAPLLPMPMPAQRSVQILACPHSSTPFMISFDKQKRLNHGLFFKCAYNNARTHYTCLPSFFIQAHKLPRLLVHCGTSFSLRSMIIILVRNGLSIVTNNVLSYISIVLMDINGNKKKIQCLHSLRSLYLGPQGLASTKSCNIQLALTYILDRYFSNLSSALSTLASSSSVGTWP